MATTLTLEFSDNINVDELLGHYYHHGPEDRALLLRMGLDVDELEETLRTKKILVSDALARLVLAQLKTALRLDDDCKVYISERQDEQFLASITSD